MRVLRFFTWVNTDPKLPGWSPPSGKARSGGHQSPRPRIHGPVSGARAVKGRDGLMPEMTRQGGSFSGQQSALGQPRRVSLPLSPALPREGGRGQEATSPPILPPDVANSPMPHDKAPVAAQIHGGSRRHGRRVTGVKSSPISREYSRAEAQHEYRLHCLAERPRDGRKTRTLSRPQ